MPMRLITVKSTVRLVLESGSSSVLGIPASLEDQDGTMIIPWEVDQVVPKKMQSSRTSQAFWTETEVSCSK